MALVDFTSQLEAADSMLDLARLLGAACLDEGGELGWTLLDPQSELELERIELGVAAIPRAIWEEVVEVPSTLTERVGSELVALIENARIRQPLDFLGVVRGLCRVVLPELYLIADGQIELDRGMPVPFATRPLNDEFACTTYQPTLSRGDLLDSLPYSFFPFPAGGQMRVVLDFSHGDRIDQLTWREGEGLPRIATLHPEGGGRLKVEEVGGGRFFGVRPAEWDADAVLALLAHAGDAEIAVLPELSLPSPDALEAGLAASPGEYSPIVVAGSAHTRTKAAGGAEIRSNESRLYLDGELVAVARKHHPYATKQVGSDSFDEPQVENLTGEPKTITVLSGRRTRLAVVVCADLLDLDIPKLLVAAGVNLLLVPAMTKEIGSFNTPVCDIPGYCQGVSVMANTRWRSDGKPFLCMVGVPRPEPGQQSAALDAAGVEPPPQIALIDPNKPLPEGVTWW
jgi:hypothetical protein